MRTVKPALKGQILARKQALQHISTPVNISRPGQNAGVSMETVKQASIDGLKSLGVAYTTMAGTIKPQLDMLSTAQELIGFSFVAATLPLDQFNLLVNGTKELDSAAVQNFQSRAGAPAYLPYFPFSRYLGGNKSVELEHTSTAGGVAFIFTIYYI